ncbi:MAG: hypothetical protein JSS83_23075 [Cyanobacteria bacterium SZAS LIN-3]|nr:hypothetical protein [Cyanobacteria bacterium SZAS LIN-3]
MGNMLLPVMCLMTGMIVWMTMNVMLSLVGLAGKEPADAITRVLSVIFGLVVLIMVFVSRGDPLLLLQAGAVFAGLGLGVYSGRRSVRKQIAQKLCDALWLSQWGEANFHRLDQNGDGVVCTLDLARFCAGLYGAAATGSPQSLEKDRRMAAQIGAAFADIGHDAVADILEQNPDARPFPVARPKVISQQDIGGYHAKLHARWEGWLA